MIVALAIQILIAVAISIGVTVALVMIRRGIWSESPLKGTQDIEGFYITVLGALYAIFVAFMIFVVWTRFYEAITTVDSEADKLMDFYRITAGLPEQDARRLQSYAFDYSQLMIEREWQSMRNETSDLQAQALVNRMWEHVIRISADESLDEVIRNQLLVIFVELTDLRRFRLLQSQTSLPGVLYALLLFGAVLTLSFAALFGSDDFWPHIIKAASLAAIVSFMLFTVWALDHPFKGRVHVSPEPFRAIQRMMQSSGHFLRPDCNIDIASHPPKITATT